MYPPRRPYPEQSFIMIRNYEQSGALPNVSYFVRSRARDYPNRPVLSALIARREAEEQYRRKFGFIPR